MNAQADLGMARIYEQDFFAHVDSLTPNTSVASIADDIMKCAFIIFLKENKTNMADYLHGILTLISL